MKVIVDGLATEYRDEGQGLAILMLHGWMDTLYSFDEIARGLMNSYRVVRLDLPGFGGSELPPGSWYIADYASFVQHFIEKIGLGSYVLLGHSFGGRVSIKAVGTGVLTPSRLILIASAGLTRRRTLRNKTLTVLAKIGKALTLMPPLSFWRQEIRKKLYEHIGSDYFLAGKLSQVYLHAISEDLGEYAKNISIPTLLLWGTNDTAVPLHDGERFAQLAKNVTLKTYQGAGHFVHHERSQDVISEIRKFI